jgi:hypothetical protein
VGGTAVGLGVADMGVGVGTGAADVPEDDVVGNITSDGVDAPVVAPGVAPGETTGCVLDGVGVPAPTVAGADTTVGVSAAVNVETSVTTLAVSAVGLSGCSEDETMPWWLGICQMSDPMKLARTSSAAAVTSMNIYVLFSLSAPSLLRRDNGKLCLFTEATGDA